MHHAFSPYQPPEVVGSPPRGSFRVPWPRAAVAPGNGARPAARGEGPSCGPEGAAGVAWHADLAYGQAGNDRLLLDLARPDRGEGPFPTVVLLHGIGPL